MLLDRLMFYSKSRREIPQFCLPRFQSSSLAVNLNPNRARPPAAMRATQLSDFGADQSPIMTGQSSNIRIRWNRATKVKIAPATIENVLRFIERSCQGLTGSQRLATQHRCGAYQAHQEPKALIRSPRPRGRAALAARRGRAPLRS